MTSVGGGLGSEMNEIKARVLHIYGFLRFTRYLLCAIIATTFIARSRFIEQTRSDGLIFLSRCANNGRISLLIGGCNRSDLFARFRKHREMIVLVARARVGCFNIPEIAADPESPENANYD